MAPNLVDHTSQSSEIAEGARLIAYERLMRSFGNLECYIEEPLEEMSAEIEQSPLSCMVIATSDEWRGVFDSAVQSEYRVETWNKICMTEVSVVPRYVMNELAATYRFRDRQAVTAFIERHPGIVQLLQEAPRVVHPYFGKHDLSLSVFVDPEDDSTDTELVLTIATDLPAREAARQLGLLQDRWLVPVTIAQGRQHILLGIEPLR